MARGGHYEHRKSSNVLLLHCIAGPYVFILYMTFHLNAGVMMMLSLRDA